MLVLLAATTVLSSCGSSSYGSGSQISPTLTGNWQFTMAPPADGSFYGGVQGGFLQQSSRSVKGAAAYAVSLSQLLIPCSNGSATITGTISGQSVTLTAVAGTQTFTFAGTLSFNGMPGDGSTFVGETMSGTYTSTAGTAPDGAPCGTAQSGLQWSAALVPPITGTVAGTFHSAGGGAGLANQDFPVAGSLTQAANSGASSAVVTGTLSFTASDYPCFNTGADSVPVYGQISGNLVTLQLTGSGGSILGQIGVTVGPSGATGVSPITFNSAQNGYILHGVGPSYLVATPNACPGDVNQVSTAGDYGNLCLAVESNFLGTGNACKQPIALTPAALTFASQNVGTSSTQTITLANSSSSALNNLTFAIANTPASPVNFEEDPTSLDTCGPGGAPTQGLSFNLAVGATCTISIAFSPQSAGTLTATFSIVSPLSPDNDKTFALPITGTGASAQ